MNREMEGADMFGRKKGPSQPTPPFAHADGCTLAKNDPDFEPGWQEGSAEGHWVRICQCWTENVYEPRVDTRTRLNPLDPATFRHLGGCEHREVTDPTIVKAILTVHERENFWHVQCSTCDGGWQVPYYAAENGG